MSDVTFTDWRSYSARELENDELSPYDIKRHEKHETKTKSNDTLQCFRKPAPDATAASSGDAAADVNLTETTEKETDSVLGGAVNEPDAVATLPGVFLVCLYASGAQTWCYYFYRTYSFTGLKNINMEHQHFVNMHYAALISRVTSVMSIADKLRGNDMLGLEAYSEIRGKTTKHEQMRVLLSVVCSGGAEVKSYFYKVLKQNEPHLVTDLEKQGLSSQATSGVLPKQEEAGAENNRPEKFPIRWNPYSKKHKSKMEQFLKDPLKREVDNIYFSENENYIIGSGSSGIVYLGIKMDGTEVAIKQLVKKQQNNNSFENELRRLQDVKLESKNIVKYVDLAQTERFYYLALQLCECDLEDYMKELRKQNYEDKGIALKKLVEEILLGLQVLHRAEVIHRDIKPGNVLIDSENNARLADFEISRKLEEGSTVYTARAGTRGWEAVETLDQSGRSSYTTKSDVQVAGMLVYYILSDGKHPFGVEIMDRETNISDGNYSVEDVQDIVAKDLIKRMISRDPAERPTVDEALQHPYFWDDHRKDAVLRKLGDRDEVQNYELLRKLLNLCDNVENSEGKDPTAKLTIDEALNREKIRDVKKREVIRNIVGEDFAKLRNLCDTAKTYTEGKTFEDWKEELSQIWTDINLKIPEDLLGLLRVLRNKLVHEKTAFDEMNMLNHFPDFYICLHGLAKDLKWEY